MLYKPQDYLEFPQYLCPQYLQLGAKAEAAGTDPGLAGQTAFWKGAGSPFFGKQFPNSIHTGLFFLSKKKKKKKLLPLSVQYVSTGYYYDLQQDPTTYNQSAWAFAYGGQPGNLASRHVIASNQNSNQNACTRSDGNNVQRLRRREDELGSVKRAVQLDCASPSRFGLHASSMTLIHPVTRGQGLIPGPT